MASYSIDQFAKITGLNKILIRTWENRYKFLTPIRTSTNIRTYNDDMLNKGIKYAILVENGHKISKLVSYDDEHLNSLIQDTLTVSESKETKYNIYISKFIESALYFDQEIFNSTYKKCIHEFGVIDFYKQVLIKTMGKISVLYLNSEITSANEHFLSENIRLQIANEIISTKNNIKKGKEWVLFLPENEYHDIGLLFSYLLLNSHQKKVLYLGQNTPRETLLEFQKDEKNYLFFINTKRTPKFAKELCSFLNNKFTKSTFYVIDNQKTLNSSSKNIKIVENIDHFTKILTSK